MKDFFGKGLNSLRSKPSSSNAQLACQQLKNFLSQDSHSVVAKLKGECKTEKEFNCIIATEVLIPLSPDHCLINKKISDAKDKRLKLPSEGGVKGLVIGFSHGYYGEADMVVVPEYEESGTVLVSAPVEKQPRIDASSTEYSATEQRPRQTSSESPDVWENIRKLAGEQQKKQETQNPPIKKKKHGGVRKMAGRQKSKPKELLVTPVKIKNSNLGHYMPKGKKEFIPFTGTEYTIKEVEDTLCKHFLGKPRDKALTSTKFHLKRTSKGPPLTNDTHLLGSSFYFWWESSLSTEDVDEDFLDEWNSDTSSTEYSATEQRPRQTSSAESPDVWENIRKLAGEQQKKQETQNPPIKKKKHGGVRKMAGRQKSKPKELLVTPVKIKNSNLGHYMPKGKKEYI